MRILVDTNVLADYITSRKSFDTSAREVIYPCRSNKISGCIAVHTVLNMIYILRKALPLKDRKALLKDICEFFDVISIDKSKIMIALENDDFSDFEDCIQSECAVTFSADYIVTRNIKDFTESIVPAVTPDDFLKIAKEMA